MDWFTNEIINGLTKLMSLSLDRTPAADSVQITAATWIEATTAGRAWHAPRDTDRIRTAFITLARTSDRWPSPKQFLDALPRVEQAALTYELKPADPARALAAIAEAQALLRSDRPEPKPIDVEHDPRPLAEVEAELVRHYGTDRKSQAAGDAS